MNTPLEVKIILKDIEPFNEFLGSLSEFQKAIFKLSGITDMPSNYGDPIRRNLLLARGFKESTETNCIEIKNEFYHLKVSNVSSHYFLNDKQILPCCIGDIDTLIRLLNL